MSGESSRETDEKYEDLKEAVGHDHWPQFLQFVKTGEAPEEFLQRLDKDSSWQEAVERAYQRQVGALGGLVESLRPTMPTPESAAESEPAHTAGVWPEVRWFSGAFVGRVVLAASVAAAVSLGLSTYHYRGELSDSATQLDSTLLAMEQLQATLDRTPSSLVDARRRIEGLKRQLHSANRTRDEAAKQVARAKTKLSESERERETVMTRAEAAEDERDQLRGQLTRAESDRRSAEKKALSLEQERLQAMKQAKELLARAKSAEDARRGALAELGAVAASLDKRQMDACILFSSHDLGLYLPNGRDSVSLWYGRLKDAPGAAYAAALSESSDPERLAEVPRGDPWYNLAEAEHVAATKADPRPLVKVLCALEEEILSEDAWASDRFGFLLTQRFVSHQAAARWQQRGVDVVPELLNVIQASDNARRRSAACAALGRIGGAAREYFKSVVEALRMSAVSKDNPGVVRVQAAQALGQLGPGVMAVDPLAVDALHELRLDESTEPYLAAAVRDALARISTTVP